MLSRLSSTTAVIALVAAFAGCSDSGSSPAAAPTSSEGPSGTPAPSILAVSPNSGPTAGGTTVTISGYDFDPAATVDFGGVAATSTTVGSMFSIVCAVPAGSAGAVDVTVTNPDSQTGTLTGGFAYGSGGGTSPAPTLAAVAPATGPVAGGQSVTLAGTNFVAGATVLFGTNAATGLTITATTITCTSPAGPAGATNVTVTNPDAQSATLAAGYAYTAGLAITSVSPGVGDVSGGTPVSIVGSGFVTGATVQVGSGLATNVTVQSSTIITANTPAGTAGAVGVVVTDPSGLQAVLASGFTYTAGGTTPSITSFTPTSGPAAGCTTITITGTSFAAGATVSVGGTAATNVTLLSTTTITCDTPHVLVPVAGGQPVTVTNSGGAASTLANAFTYTSFPIESMNVPASSCDVAVDAAGNIHVVWELGSPGEIAYVSSSDGGCTWSASVANLSGTFSNASARPRVAANGKNVFVVWNETTNSNPKRPEEAWFSYSADNGQNWSKPGIFVMGSTWKPNPDVALGGGRFYLIYEVDGGQASTGTGFAVGSGGQYSSIHLQHGVLIGWPLFATIVPLQTGSVAARFPVLTASGGINGRVHAAWQQVNGILPSSSTAAGWEIYASRSTDAGKTWDTPVNISSTSVGSTGPSLAYLGSTVVCAWREGTTSFAPGMNRSTDAGASWGTSSTQGPSYAAMNGVAAAGDGFSGLTLTWSATTSGSASQVFTARSTDSGQTVSAPVDVSGSSGSSTQPQVAYWKTGIALRVWIDDTQSTSVPDVLGY